MAHVQPPSRRGRHRFSLFGAKIYAVPEPTPEEDGSSPTKEDGSVPKVDENEDRAVSTVAGHTPETTSDPSGLTTTTSGTFPGLGAVLGKLARALGKLELRLIECIIIQRRLLHIKRHLSAGDTSENDMVSNEGGLEMFDDIWELSRAPHYSEFIRKQAYQLILTQIARGNTSPLVISLLRWKAVEIRLFLSGITECMHPEWAKSGNIPTHMRQKLLDHYISAFKQHRRNCHLATSFVQFFREVAKANASSCRALLGAGILDTLLSMYLDDFLPSTSPVNENHSGRMSLRTSLIAACDLLLSAFSAHPEFNHILSAHPLCTLWPNKVSLPSTSEFRGRHTIWRTLEKTAVTQRLRAIKNTAFAPTPFPLSEGEMYKMSTDLIDIFVDLVEFSSPGNSEHYDAETATEALSTLSSLSGHDANLGMLARIHRCFTRTGTGSPDTNTSTARLHFRSHPPRDVHDGSIRPVLEHSVPKVHYLSLLDIVTLAHLAHNASRLTEVIILLVQLSG